MWASLIAGARQDKAQLSALKFLASQGAAQRPASRRVEGPIICSHGEAVAAREGRLAFSNLRARSAA